MTFPMTIIDTAFKALAPAIPDRVIAGHHADLMSANVHGIDPKKREFFIGGFGPLGGGWGAQAVSEDGVSATVCLNDVQDTHNGALRAGGDQDPRRGGKPRPRPRHGRRRA